MTNFNFSSPSRQSSSGVAVLLFLSFIKILRQAYIILIVFAFQIISDPDKFTNSLPYLSLGFVALLLYLLIFNFLKFKNFKFHVEGDQFVLSEGILNKSNTVLSFDKIQNVNIKQNVLHQILNVVQLDIDSAGDKTTEISITALEKDKALALKAVLLSGDKIAMETETKEAPEESIKISPMTLFLTGISENHVKSFLVLAAACIGLFSDFEEVLKAIGQEAFFNEIESGLLGSNPKGFVMLFLGIAVLLVVSVVYSISSIFIKNLGLTVSTVNNKVEVHKGLFNKVSYALHRNRVQSVHYETNFLKRKLGLHNVKILQAMATEKSKKNIQIVGIRNEELGFLEKLLFAVNPFAKGAKEKPNKYYFIQLLFRSVTAMLLFGVIGFVAIGIKSFWALLAIVPIVLLFNYIKYKKSYFILTKEFLISGAGSISTLTAIVESHKVQTVNINQNFFQKRKGLADLNIFVASTKITFPCVEYKRAIDIYNYVLFNVESANKNWL